MEDMLSKFKDLDTKMSIKVYYPFSLFDRLPTNHCDLSEEHGEALPGHQGHGGEVPGHVGCSHDW